MRVPAAHGLIRRRILVNFRVKAHVAQRLLPPGFEPKLVKGWVIASISLLVHDAGDMIELTMRSSDGETTVELVAEAAPSLPTTSRFHSLAEASAFFEAGSLGYSPSGSGDRLDALELRTSGWNIEPLAIRHVYSSFFADEQAVLLVVVINNRRHERVARFVANNLGAVVAHKSDEAVCGAEVNTDYAGGLRAAAQTEFNDRH